MIENIINMGGYGIFVWSAFIFTFFCCLYLFISTKKELKKCEKEFLTSLENLPKQETQIIKNRKIVKDILAENPSIN